MRRGPFSLYKALKGAIYPFFFSLTLRTYDPATIKSTPTSPKKPGNSPTIMGDVRRRNNGVSIAIGDTMERSEYFTALIDSTVVIAFRLPPPEERCPELVV